MKTKSIILFNSIFFIGIFIFLIFSFTGCNKSGPQTTSIELHGHTMGTTYQVKISDAQYKAPMTPETLTEKLNGEIDQVLKTVNLHMSTFIENSEISLFNNYQGTDWFNVSPDTAKVMEESIRISRLSEGAFDITVAPLINLWGFGPKHTNREIPPDSEIQNVLSQIGYKNLSVRYSPPGIKKEIPAITCNLSAIAKGYGVDCVGEYIEKLGYKNYLVEIGGEIRARGLKVENKKWTVAIASPDGGPGFEKILSLTDLSMATSGDYHNYFEKDGVRYSHTIDPSTGKPITHSLASVTVIHSSCMTADAFATAIDVLGPEKGYELALREGLPVFLILHSPKGFVEKMTPSFKQYFAE